MTGPLLSYNDLLAVVSDAGVEVSFNDPGIDTAAVSLNDGKYRLSVNAEFINGLSEQAALEVISHEIAHILRGDCLLAAERGVLWNIATDAVINHALRDLQAEVPGIITYSSVRERFGDETWPEYLPNADIIYARLASQAPGGIPIAPADGTGSGPAISDPMTGDVRPAQGDPDVNAAEHARAAAEIRSRARAAGIDIPGDPGSSASADVPDGARAVSPEACAVDAVVRRVRRMIADSRGVNARRDARTWRRSRNGLPLRLPLPAAGVAVCVDVSASMTDIVPRIMHLAKRLQDELGAETWTWDTGARRVRRIGREVMVPEGGGTDIRALARALATDVAVIVTDGEIYPDPVRGAIRARRVLWVLTADRKTLPSSATRPGDGVIHWEGAK